MAQQTAAAVEFQEQLDGPFQPTSQQIDFYHQNGYVKLNTF